MDDQRVEVETTGQNVAGEVPAAEPDAVTDDDVQTLLDGVADWLVDLGMTASAIETGIERDRDSLDAIADAADAFDAVVMGESDPSLTTFVFGMPADQVAERFLGPVLVVQRESSTEGDGR